MSWLTFKKKKLQEVGRCAVAHAEGDAKGGSRVGESGNLGALQGSQTSASGRAHPNYTVCGQNLEVGCEDCVWRGKALEKRLTG